MKVTLNKSLLKAPDNKYLIALLPRLKEKKVQNFTTLALTLITFSIFAIFAIAPTVGTIADLQKQIDDNQFVSNQLQQKITTLSLLQDNYSRLGNQLPAVFDGIPTDAQIATFLGQLQSVAVLSNVNVERVQTLPVDLSLTTGAINYSSYAFAIDVDGTPDNISIFLNNLIGFSRLVSIDALSYGKATRLASIYKLSVRGKTYFQP